MSHRSSVLNKYGLPLCLTEGQFAFFSPQTPTVLDSLRAHTLLPSGHFLLNILIFVGWCFVSQIRYIVTAIAGNKAAPYIANPFLVFSLPCTINVCLKSGKIGNTEWRLPKNIGNAFISAVVNMLQGGIKSVATILRQIESASFPLLKGLHTLLPMFVFLCLWEILRPITSRKKPPLKLKTQGACVNISFRCKLWMVLYKLKNKCFY